MHPPFVEPHRQYNGQSARLEYGRSWVRVKPKTINLVFVASPLNTHHWVEKAKSGWLVINIMCPSGASCLPADCCD